MSVTFEGIKRHTREKCNFFILLPTLTIDQTFDLVMRQWEGRLLYIYVCIIHGHTNFIEVLE